MASAQVTPERELKYTTELWIQDAAILKSIWDIVQNNETTFPGIKELIQEADRTRSFAVLQLLSPEARQDVQAKAVVQVLLPISAALSTVTFVAFLERFRKGPNHYLVNPDRAISTTASVTGGNATDYVGNTKRRTRDGYTGQAKRRSRGNGNEHADNPERRQNINNRVVSEPHTQKGLQGKRLNIRSVEYDGKSSITSYINRLKYMAQSYGSDALLSVLPLAMIGKARTWFDSLPSKSRTAMNSSLDVWYSKLLAYFQKDMSKSLEEADQMKHRFDGKNGAITDVREYMTQKLELYNEAGEQSEDLMVRRLHAGLDPTLKITIHLQKCMNTLDIFQQKVYTAELPAKDQFLEMRHMIDQSRKEERRNFSTARQACRFDTEQTTITPTQGLQSPLLIPKNTATRLFEQDLNAITGQATQTPTHPNETHWPELPPPTHTEISESEELVPVNETLFKMYQDELFFTNASSGSSNRESLESLDGDSAESNLGGHPGVVYR
jgi:hypothetical protein